jgi:hypothetical protein
VLVGLTLGTASARDIDLVALRDDLSPIARRFAGSGLQCRSIASADGSRHKLKLAAIKLRAHDRVIVRAGVGGASASVEPFLLAPRDEGLAFAGSVSVAVWQDARFALDLNLSASHASYAQRAVGDATVVVALRKL